MAGSTTNYALTKPAVGEAYDVNVFNNNADIVDTQLKAVDVDKAKYAKGVVNGPTKVTTSSGSVSDAIISNIATFTFKANRNYRVVWDPTYYQSVTSDIFEYSINTCLVADSPTILTGLTVIGKKSKGVLAGATLAQHTGLVTAYHKPGSDSTVQIKFRVQRAVGTGTAVVTGSAAEPTVYTIYDDGQHI